MDHYFSHPNSWIRKERGKVRRKRRKAPVRKKIYTIGIILVVLLVLLAGGTWWSGNLKPVSDSSDKVAFVLEPGMNASEVAAKLETDHLIRQASVFRQLCRINKADSKLVAGLYYLSPSMSSREILDTLMKGPEPEVVRITIPEGYTVAQIVDKLVENSLGTKNEFYDAMERFDQDNYSFLADIPSGENRLEGFLFPDTYFFDKKATPSETIERFLQRFKQELTAETTNRLAERNMSVFEWLIKASLVEKEAKKAEERPLIAGVFENRLKIDMPLESCATIQYILGEVKPVLTIADTQIDSPYNTYRNTGLPPGPIANPGHASLQAALYPKDTDYFFFVAKNDGSHAFAVTYEEHLKNVSIYQ